MDKLRTRLVNFRVSEEEFERLQRACKKQGARCLSEFARSVMLACPKPASDGIAGDIEALGRRVGALEASMGQLADIIGQAVGAVASRPGG